MAKVIQGVPEFVAREDYLKLIRSTGFNPEDIQDLRFSTDGIHAVVFYRDADGSKRQDPSSGSARWAKHRVFIPIRDHESETKSTRVKPVKGK